MDWNNYFKEQINKSNNHSLNKVSDLTGNQTGGFIRPFGNFLREQNAKLTKLLFRESYQRAVEEHQRVKKENKEKRKKLVESRKKIAEVYGEEQERGFLGRYNPLYLLNNAILKIPILTFIVKIII